MEKSAPAVKSILHSRTTAPAISADQIACANCKFVHMNHDLTYACWKAPPTAVAAWVQTRDGSMNLQVGGARSPVERDSWCGEFSRKTSA
jgi:hypothetical protein